MGVLQWANTREPVMTVSMGAEAGKKKNTTNMWSHLKVHHPPAYQEAPKKRDAAAARATDPRQPTVIQMFDAQWKWQDSDPRSKQMDTLVIEMIATDNQPYTVVSDVGFRRLLAAAEPR